MTSSSEFPAWVLQVLVALWEHPTQWQDESTLARQAGLPPDQLKAAMRYLAARGLAQITQLVKAQPGQPAEEQYRLTAEGLARAVIALADVGQPAG